MSEIPGPPAGWYDDPSEPGVSRWWDGTAWAPSSTAPHAEPEPPQRPAASSAALVIGIVLSAIGLLSGLAGSGFGGLLVMGALILGGTALFAVVLRRPSWLRFGSRRRAIGWLAGAAVLLMVGGGITSATQTPSPDLALTGAVPTAEATPTPSPKASETSRATPTPTATLTPTPPPPVPSIPVAGVAGQSAEQATQAFASSGLNARFVDAAGSDVPNASGWTVVSTTPAAGELLLSGATVTVTITPPAPAPAPPAPAAPAPAPDQHGGATALCKDGTLSYSQNRRGTCSHHGGVQIWY